LWLWFFDVVSAAQLLYPQVVVHMLPLWLAFADFAEQNARCTVVALIRFLMRFRRWMTQDCTLRKSEPQSVK